MNQRSRGPAVASAVLLIAAAIAWLVGSYTGPGHSESVGKMLLWFAVSGVLAVAGLVIGVVGIRMTTGSRVVAAIPVLLNAALLVSGRYNYLFLVRRLTSACSGLAPSLRSSARRRRATR